MKKMNSYQKMVYKECQRMEPFSKTGFKTKTYKPGAVNLFDIQKFQNGNYELSFGNGIRIVSYCGDVDLILDVANKL